jgi:hypothetical protein
MIHPCRFHSSGGNERTRPTVIRLEQLGTGQSAILGDSAREEDRRLTGACAATSIRATGCQRKHRDGDERGSRPVLQCEHQLNTDTFNYRRQCLCSENRRDSATMARVKAAENKFYHAAIGTGRLGLTWPVLSARIGFNG